MEEVVSVLQEEPFRNQLPVNNPTPEEVVRIRTAGKDVRKKLRIALEKMEEEYPLGTGETRRLSEDI